MNAHWFQNCKEQLATWSHIAIPKRKNAGTASPQVSALEARILFDANPSFGAAEELVGLDLSLDFESLFQPADLPLHFSGSIQVDGSLDVELPEDYSPQMPLDDLNITAEAEISAVGREIVVIDASIDDYQTILDGIGKQAGIARDITVLITRPNQDGIGEITALLTQLENVTAIHIISHARDGEIFLGNSVLNLNSLADRAGDLAIWRAHLSSSADLLIYGCDLAASDVGEQFVDQLAVLTEADIAASDDLTGHQSLSGDWELEYQAGWINTSSLASSHSFDPWFGLLATTTSTVTTGNQETTDDNGGSQHAIAMDAAGNFVVVWSSDDNAVGRDTNGYGVYAQRYDRFGAKVGVEIVVNNQRGDDQDQASVAMDDAGNFVVVWADHTTSVPGSAIKVMAKRYDANGNTIMSDTQITSGSNDSINPTVAMSSVGEYVIAWQNASTSEDVYAALFDSNGATLATSFRVHAASPDAEINPSVAIADNGSFAVFWQDSAESHGNRFDRFGASELASPLTIVGSSPGVAIDSDGSMLLTYNSGNEIWADKYSPGGSLTSSQSLSGPLFWVSDPTVSRANDGSYIVSWNADGAGFDFSNVFVAQLSASGAVLGVSEILDSAFQSSGSVAAYDVNHYAYAYTTRVFIDGDVEVGHVGTWGSPPTSTDTFNLTSEDISYIFAPSDFPFADADSDPFTQIRVLSIATNGILLLNGIVFSPMQVITVAQLTAGQLAFVPNADENGAAYSTFDFQVHDGTAYSVTRTFTINVDPVNDGPQLLPPTTFNVAENQTTVGTIVASDPDSAVLTYSIVGGVDAAKFAIDNSTGALRFIAAPDFETPTDNGLDNIYEFIVEVSDGSLTDTQAMAVAVTNVNDSNPTITSNGGGFNAAVNIAENTTSVTTVTATDTDIPVQALTYSIVGGVDASKFSINSLTGELSFMSPPDFESPDDAGANRTYEVIVGVSDGLGGSDSQLLNISVTPVNDNPPVFSSPATFNVNENTTAVGTIVATDADQAAQTVTFSIAGGADASKFTLSGNSLRFYFGRDFESPRDFDSDNVYEVDIRATDGFGGTTIQSVSAVVLNVNESPSNITPRDIFVNENTDTTSGYRVGVLTALDPDLADSHTFSIVGGDDRNKFTLGGINGNELILTAGILNFESEDRYEVRIRVRDAGGRSTEREIRVHVRDVNETPTALEPDNFNVDENIDTTLGRFLGILDATDQDDNESFTYAIVGGANASSFSLAGGSGDRLVLSAGVLNFENQALYEVIVRVTDSGGLSFDQAITVDVNDVNEAPSAIGESITLLEGATHSALSGWLMANDFDPESDVLTASVVSGPQHGSLQLLSDGTFIYQHDGSETTSDRFQYAINDGNGHSAAAWVDIAITPVNDLPDARRDTIVLSSFSPIVLDSSVLLANDTDAEGGLTISWVRSGLNGTVSLGTDGKIYYTPIPNSEGRDQFIYQIVDSNGAVDHAVVTIVTPTPIVEKPAPAPAVGDSQPKTTPNNSPPALHSNPTPMPATMSARFRPLKVTAPCGCTICMRRVIIDLKTLPRGSIR